MADNAGNNNTMVDEMERQMAANSYIWDAKIHRLRYLGHIINLAAEDSFTKMPQILTIQLNGVSLAVTVKFIISFFGFASHLSELSASRNSVLLCLFAIILLVGIHITTCVSVRFFSELLSLSY